MNKNEDRTSHYRKDEKWGQRVIVSNISVNCSLTPIVFLNPRNGNKGIGEKIYVNGDTAEVTGYFGTDDWSINKVKRPTGILSIETATGLMGNGANLLSITKLESSNSDSDSDSDSQYSFFYTKNWLYISGLCNGIYRHK